MNGSVVNVSEMPLLCEALFIRDRPITHNVQTHTGRHTHTAHFTQQHYSSNHCCCVLLGSDTQKLLLIKRLLHISDYWWYFTQLDSDMLILKNIFEYLGFSHWFSSSPLLSSPLLSSPLLSSPLLSSPLHLQFLVPLWDLKESLSGLTVFCSPGPCHLMPTISMNMSSGILFLFLFFSRTI